MISMQSNMQAQEELAALFSRNLTFNPQAQIQQQQQQPAPEPVPSQPITYSISRHYHHSAHVVKPQEEIQRPSSEPPQGQVDALENALRGVGIDPSNLTPSQLQLFRTADEPQQMRLIELWNICPPSRGESIPPQAWSSRTVAQEEELAQLRYEKMQQAEQGMGMNGAAVQSADGTWAQDQSDSDSEPYMISGYQELMRREQEMQPRTLGNSVNAYGGQGYSRSTDPVFMGPDSVRQQEQMAMAMQYGALEQFRSNSVPSEAMDVVM